MTYKLPKVNTKYGAPMGCYESIPNLDIHDDDQIDYKFRLWQVKLDSGGYDNGGAYWGIGEPLYCAQSTVDDIVFYMRARNREAAKAQVVEMFPLARFFR